MRLVISLPSSCAPHFINRHIGLSGLAREVCIVSSFFSSSFSIWDLNLTDRGDCSIDVNNQLTDDPFACTRAG